MLEGGVKSRCREILVQICESEDVDILKRVFSNNHTHIDYGSSLSISNLVKKLKGRASRKEFPKLEKLIGVALFQYNLLK